MTQTDDLDIFAMSTTTTKAETASKKTTKAGIIMEGKENKVSRYVEIKNTISSLEAEQAMLRDDITSFGREEYLKQFEADKKQPESFNVMDEAGGKVLFIVQDKYAKITKEKLPVLQQLKCVTEKKTVILNPDILKKYSKDLSKAILAVIPQEEWKDVFLTHIEHSVTPGTLGSLHTIGIENFGLIQPQIMLK